MFVYLSNKQNKNTHTTNFSDCIILSVWNSIHRDQDFESILCQHIYFQSNNKIEPAIATKKMRECANSERKKKNTNKNKQKNK